MEESKLKFIKDVLEGHPETFIVSEDEESYNLLNITVAMENGTYHKDRMYMLFRSLIEKLDPDNYFSAEISHPLKATVFTMYFLEKIGKEDITYRITQRCLLDDKGFLRHHGFNNQGEKVDKEIRDICRRMELVLYPTGRIARDHLEIKKMQKQEKMLLL